MMLGKDYTLAIVIVNYEGRYRAAAAFSGICLPVRGRVTGAQIGRFFWGGSGFDWVPRVPASDRPAYWVERSHPYRLPVPSYVTWESSRSGSDFQCSTAIPKRQCQTSQTGRIRCKSAGLLTLGSG